MLRDDDWPKVKETTHKESEVITLISNQNNPWACVVPLLLVLLYQSSGTSAFFQILSDLHNLLVVHIYVDILKRGRPGWIFKFQVQVQNMVVSLQPTQFVPNIAHGVWGKHSKIQDLGRCLFH